MADPRGVGAQHAKQPGLQNAANLGWARLPIGLGARLVLAQLLVAAAIVGVAYLDYLSIDAAQERVSRVYDHRVLPLSWLGQVADEFAIDFVDAVHKVSDGSLSVRDGAKVLTRVRDDSHARWQQAEALMTTPREHAVLQGIRPVLKETLVSLDEALSLMLTSDVGELRHWRARLLYTRVDPLTARLHALLDKEGELAHEELVAVRIDMKRSAVEGALALVVAGFFAVAVGVFVAIRFLASLRQIDRATQRAAAGDLSVRVGLQGNDELAAMAKHVDEMIGAVQQSQTTLAEQANALSRSEAEARAANAAKSSFLSNVSHELRTPLNVILGHAQVSLRDKSLPPEHARSMSRILQSGSHLLELIDDLLGITRLEASATELHPASFSPDALIDELVRMLGSRAQDKGLELRVERDGALPSAIHADRRRLLQVLLNLTGNALKFTMHGHVTLRAWWRDGRLGFEVADTGPGISAEDQAALFTTFSQGERGRASGEGTGLGLYISQSLVRLMDGEIQLESAPGEGARFSFSVLAKGSAAAELVDDARPVKHVPPDAKLAPMLVVDDRAGNREVLRALLESAGFTVQEAADGQAALRWLEQQRASVVWLDLRMPVLDGFETIKTLRARETSQGAPRAAIVAITASAIEVDAARAEALGFDGLIIKPFREQAIFDIVERLLSLQLSGQSPALCPTSPERHFDVALLPAAERDRLLRLLTLGDIHEACALVDRLGPVAEPLRREIESFRTDPILTKLQQLNEGP
jgi:signal transduction histidine kinase/CheY-like chemotaxis protein